MKVLLLNGSPKKTGSASKFLLKFLRMFLWNNEIIYLSLEPCKDTQILEQLVNVDVLVLSAPLYVDGIPSHILDFLQKADDYLKEHPCELNMYVISNNGFIEGKQNRVHLKQYECFCEHTPIHWCGGIGIGGGVMCHILSIVYPSIITLELLVLIIRFIGNNIITLLDWKPIIENLFFYLFLNSGVLYGLHRLSNGINKKIPIKNLYTRIMVPSFLFWPFANAFMLLSALLNGRFIFSLFKKEQPKEAGMY